jgi:glycosyltransferase domain-containing protein
MATNGSDRLTIVVPTFNRPRHLRRLLLLLKELGNPYPVLILDGSSAENQAKNREVQQEFEKNVILKQYPQGLHLGLRLADGVRQVKTEYMVFCADDDFVLPASIAECLKFLGEHPTYSAAMGRVHAMGYSHRYFTRGIFVIDDLANDYHLNMKTFIERFMALRPYYNLGCPPLFYAVRKTKVAVEAFDLANDKMLHGTLEWLGDMIALLRGPVVVLPFLYGFRDYACEAIREPLRRDYAPHDVEYLLPIMTKKIRETEGCSEDVAKYVAQRSLDPLLTKEVEIEKFHENNRFHHAAWAGVRTKRQRLLKAIGSAYFPSIMARVLRIEPKVMKAIRSAQSALT